jgi:hypothetical protein
MIGLRLACSITLALGGLFSPVAAEAQQAAKVARIGYLSLNLAAAPPTCTRPSVKDSVTSVTSRVATS